MIGRKILLIHNLYQLQLHHRLTAKVQAIVNNTRWHLSDENAL